jgi:fatty-acyl-CoA synthase
MHRYMLNAADILSQRALLTPGREAILDLTTNQWYTFADLNHRSNRLANFMRDRVGVQQGDRVAILAHNCIAYSDLLYGLAKIGAVFTPFNWRLTARELAYILEDCQPKVFVCGPEFSGLLQELLSSYPVETIIALEGALIPGAFQYEKELDLADESEPDRPDVDGEEPCCILYTSGTTGRPKGAVIPHRQILFNAINTVISWGLTQDDVAPILTPMFHGGGLFVFLTPLNYVGGRIVLARDFDPEKSLRTIINEKCTVILGVPTLFQMWMNIPFFKQADFSQVRFFISGGAPCPVSLIRAWRDATGVVFRQGYGLTEVGTNCFSMTDEDSARKAGSVGKPIFHSRMRLVDSEDRDVAVGQTGELIISGPHVCLGYWNKSEATAQALRGGWFHTGDMAYQDDDGFFYISGRYKDMIISGGENVYAAEVEAVFREHSAVADAALIGQPDEKWGEVGLMVVALKPNRQASEEELLEFCRQRVARYKIPKRIVFVDTLPYSPYGKVIKANLRERFVIQKT